MTVLAFLKLSLVHLIVKFGGIGAQYRPFLVTDVVQRQKSKTALKAKIAHDFFSVMTVQLPQN